jgi:hypothetical protein
MGPVEGKAVGVDFQTRFFPRNLSALSWLANGSEWWFGVSGRRISTADFFLLFFVARATQKIRNLTLGRQSRLPRIESWIGFEMGWWRPKSATDVG